MVEFIDFGGADILHHASREMAGSIDAARYAAPPVIGRMMAEGRLGLKSGEGFYDYRGRDAVAYRRDVLARTLAQVKQRRAVAAARRRPASAAAASGDAAPTPTPPSAAATSACRTARCTTPTCGDEAPRAAGAAAAPDAAQLARVRARCCRSSARIAGRSPSTRPASANPTRWRTASIEAWAGAAIDALDALGIARAHVVGHHTGGVIAVELAARAPERVASLALSSTPYTDAAFRRARAERPPIDAVEPSGDGSHLAALWQKRQPFYPADRPELLQAFVADALKASGDVEAGHRAVASYRMEDKLGAVRAPVLLLHASDDPFAAPHLAEWRRLLPEAKLATIEGGVPLPDQRPRAFAAALLAFLDALP